MKKYIDLSGCGTALITPFKNGAVDYDAFAALVDRQVAAGIDVLVPLGTTGETPCLEDDERIKILQITKEHSNGLPIIVGGGTNSLQHTIRSMKQLEPYGVDAFLIVVPYYNKPTQEGQYQYFKAVAESTEKPIVLYNVPGRTGVPRAHISGGYGLASVASDDKARNGHDACARHNGYARPLGLHI